MATFVPIDPLGLLIFGGLIYAGIVGVTANSITNAINEERKGGKSGIADAPEPQLPNPKGIGSVEQITTWTLYARGPDGSYWPKGTTTTDPGLPKPPPGAVLHK